MNRTILGQGAVAGMAFGGEDKLSEPVRDPGVLSSIGRLSSGVSQMEYLIRELESRLGPVMSMPAPETAKNPTGIQANCELSSVINDQTEALTNLSYRLSGILGRLEI